MKEKSKFVSSVIVSLLAGFIYYQLSGDFTEKFSNSVKAILVSDNSEMYGPFKSESYSSIIKNSSGIKKKNNSKLYIKSKVNKKSDSDNSFENKLVSDLNSENQAKFRRPSADKNIDFTAELNKLNSGKHKSLSELDDELRMKSIDNEIADMNEFNKVKMYIKKDKKNSGVNGYGFEYNHIKNKSGKVKNNKKDINGIKESNGVMNKSESSCEFNSGDNCAPKSKSKIIYNKTKKIKYVKEKNEIIMPDNELDDNTM